MKKILCLVGTRPEVIKMAPVVFSLRQNSFFDVVVCATSQHRTMQDQMLQLFDICPEYDLDVMRPGQDLFYLTSEILQRLQKVMNEVKPDLVLVQGDTTTCFVGALSAFYNQCQVGHVEAGLRSYDKTAPFPEETNRLLTTHLTHLHFAPTDSARDNLLREGVAENTIFVTGNTVIDALLYAKEKLLANVLDDPVITNLSQIFEKKLPYILITGHRRESFGEGFLSICQAIKNLALKYPHYHFIYPVHLNPNVQEPVNKILGGIANIHLISPVNYPIFVYLMSHCYLVLTDSGGVQEEAPSLGKPVLVMREKSERIEGITAGTAKLVGMNHENIIQNVSDLIENKNNYLKMSQAVNPYGNGLAAQKITSILLECFK